MAPRPGWKSLIYGTLYEVGDLRLTGYGNPPNDPEYQSDPKNHGAGQVRLAQVVVDDGAAPGELTEVQ